VWRPIEMRTVPSAWLLVIEPVPLLINRAAWRKLLLSVALPSEDVAADTTAAADANQPVREEHPDREALPHAAAETEVARSRLTLRARVIAEETGAPLAGCEVSALRADEKLDPPDDAAASVVDVPIAAPPDGPVEPPGRRPQRDPQPHRPIDARRGHREVEPQPPAENLSASARATFERASAALAQADQALKGAGR